MKRSSPVILVSEDEYGKFDESTNSILVKGKMHHLGISRVIEPGDELIVSGKSFIVSDFSPMYFGRVIRRNTQIISEIDASYIIMRCGLRPGMDILEVGVGSGNMSSYILYALNGKGTLTVVERDEDNLKKAMDNLSEFYDIGNVRTSRSDIADFISDQMYDAVIADIPDPWNHVQKIASMMKPGSVATFYLPNFDQSEKTVLSLSASGMHHLETVELMKRRILVREGATRPASDDLTHTAFITFAIKKSGMVYRI
ncbi:conserved hypothetical protein [Thermoplasma acidophilum]|uniref:tRNA (adenine(58)-N(1))-methyltransferase catalytic subunit TRM61 C-terminal domain-containing protein n=1 Tax=Thermoplasma acidophilum (strain ATCC 25905 / DSM 1728 / JCM 9062 / NBRC 15155 / AMRC-C165) TaxID=273075 RepID=Q9HJW1_THEAC|nr:conserved hypothetical protein [Thermoplasma acidophilum]